MLIVVVCRIVATKAINLFHFYTYIIWAYTYWVLVQCICMRIHVLYLQIPSHWKRNDYLTRKVPLSDIEEDTESVHDSLAYCLWPSLIFLIILSLTISSLSLLFFNNLSKFKHVYVVDDDVSHFSHEGHTVEWPSDNRWISSRSSH